MKLQEKEEMKIRKNFYHDVESLSWDKNFKGQPADFIGLLPKNQSDIQFDSIGTLTKMQKANDWVKPYNEKDQGAFLYLTVNEKA